MNDAWIRKAGAMPARQLHMIGGGLLLVAASALWFYGLRAPLNGLRAVRAEQAQLVQTGSDPRLLAAQLAALKQETRLLAERLGTGPAQAPARMLVGLVGELGAMAQVHGVRLHAVTPAPDEITLSFMQVGFNIDASGSYAGLLAWMEAIEGMRTNLSIASIDMRPSPTPGQVVMNIRIAVFEPQESTP